MLLAFADVLPYAAIFVGMLFEGDLLLFGTTFLSLRGTLDWRIALPLAAAGALLGDLGWYWWGTRMSAEGKPARALRSLTRLLDGRIDRMPRRVLFISKITYGLHRPIQLRFGLERFGVARFFRADLPATAVWFAVISGLALLARLTLLPISRYLRILELTVLIIFVLFLTLESGASRIMRAWLLTEEGKDQDGA